MENSLRIEGYELLSQKVYRVLKTEIAKGFLEPGEKLFGNKIATYPENVCHLSNYQSHKPC